MFLSRLLAKLHTSFFISPTHTANDTLPGMIGSGVNFKNQTYVTHTTLHHSKSAISTFAPWQFGLIMGLIGLVSFGFIIQPLVTAIFLASLLSLIYLVDVFFNLFVILKSLHIPPEIQATLEEISALDETKLPVYSVLCPLYKEAHVLPQFVAAMEKMVWPKKKLEILLLLEANDEPTIAAAKAMSLPSNFKILIVPHSSPKTKPKACNYGLGFASGKFIVVFDAEDQPDPLQLKQAYLGFLRSSDKVVCLQAKLNYYNPSHNLLTRLFTAEYSLWFDVILPGLQSISTSIPLGGTSNHFRTNDLKRLEGWDPFNVTEDCDLGARIFQAGYQTAIIDSTTLEEANSDVKNWFRQRSRWLKGYMQTYLVHMRDPLKFMAKHGIHALVFQLIVGGRIAFILINPLLWALTLAYFVLYAQLGAAIEAVYPGPVFYMAVTSLTIGNFTYLYNYMIGCAKRGHWNLIKFIFLIPFYWLMISYAAVIALFQLFFKPHYWEKTIHGLHLEHAAAQELKQLHRLEASTKRGLKFQKLTDLITNAFTAGGVMVIANLVANVMNFLYNAYLGRNLSLKDFGEISLFGSLLALTSVPLSALSRSVTHSSAFLLGKYGTPIKAFWQSIQKKSALYSLIVSLVWLALIPILMKFFKVDSALPFILFAPVWMIGTFNALNGGFLSGNLLFMIPAATAILEAATKFGVTAGLISFNLAPYVYVSIPLSLFIVMLVEWWSIRKLPNSNQEVAISPSELKLSNKFYLTSILTSLTKATYLSLDLILAKHFLSPQLAGAYSYLSLAGKMVFFLSSMFSQFLIPYASKDLGSGTSPKQSFQKLFVLISVVNFGAFIIFGVLGFITAPLLWGSKAQLIVPYLPAYALAMALFSTTSAIITYQQIRGRYLFPIFGFILANVMALGMYLEHHSIGEIVLVVAIASVINLIGVLLLDRFYSVANDFFHAAIDFFGLFRTLPPTSPLPGGKLRILIFNWRDLKHKWAGGAEVYLHELSKRWIALGHEVTLFCGNDGKNIGFERIDDIKIARRGGFYLVYFWAFMYYQFRLKGRYDVIIDSENGLPFFTPLYAKEKVFLLIHHVHQAVFRKSLVPPFSWLAQFLEKQIMPLVYRKTEVITVSPSSKADILNHKLTSKLPHVIYNGVNLETYIPGKKAAEPTVLYLGRLTSVKSIHVLIESIKLILTSIPRLKVIIAGDGPAKKSLEKLTAKLGLSGVVSFAGKVTEAEKISLYQKAWVFVNPSLIEGWGITTIEANACGTPVVASNVAGLRDAVQNPHTGYLVEYGNTTKFAAKIKYLLVNKKTWQKLSTGAIEWAKKFDWNKSASQAINVLNQSLPEHHDFSWISHSPSPSYPKQLQLGTANYNGQVIFVKSWINPPKSAFNEIETYQAISRKLVGKIRLPKLLFVDQIANTLSIGLEYVDGKTLAHSSQRNQLKIYNQVLAKLARLNLSKQPSIGYRSAGFLVVTFLYILAKAISLRPQLAKLIFRSGRQFGLGAKDLFKGKLKLVHRDLGLDNILVTPKNIFLIDWQYAAISLPIYELVGIWRSLSRDRGLAEAFITSIKPKYLTNKLALSQFKSLAIYYSLLGLTDLNYPTSRINDFVYLLNLIIKL